MTTKDKSISKRETNKHWLVGKSEGKIDGYEKVNGDLLYLEDLVLPRMLYGAILRSPHPHATIKNIDVSKAKDLAGVRAVITAEDTPKIKFSYIDEQSDNLALCDTKVRFIGDEVAAVACETPELAEKALELIEVEYEELPALFTTEQALKEGAPLIHEDRPNNISFERHVGAGNIEEAFAEADHVFEDTFSTSKQAHTPLERRGSIVKYEQTGKYTVYSQTQTPHTLRKEIAKVLDVNVTKIHVIRMPIGGGFGNRLVMDMKEPIAAFLSKKTNRPVRITNTRKEEFETSRTRYPYEFTVKTGVTKEGKILGRHVTAVLNSGAYSDKGPNTMGLCMGVNDVLYNVGATKFDGYIVYTNNQYGTGFRGFGNPQITFAIESHMDLIAERLNLNPLDFRMRNANHKGDVSPGGKVIDTISMPETLLIATERSNFVEKWEKYSSQPKDQKKRRGIGLACVAQTGGGTRANGFNSVDAFIKLSEVGQMSIITSGSEMGQGSQTAIAQIAGEVLGIDLENIKVIDNDTNVIPYDLGSWGSRTTYVNGLAVKEAAEQARDEILQIAVIKFNVPLEGIALQEGKIGPKLDWSKAVPVTEMISFGAKYLGRTITARGQFYDPEAPMFVRGEGSHALPILVYGCQIAEIEIDTETGQIEVLKVTAVHDVGKAINPAGAQAQIEGGIIQGIGYAITEGIMEHEGRALNPSFLDYKILSSPDIPEMDIHLVEDSENEGPFGAKGVGEVGIVPTAGAIANAVNNALGIRISDLPLKPEKVLNYIENSSR